MLSGLSLFSGIGGIDLALSEWVRPVAYCEIEPYAAGVLFSRMLDGSIPTAPIFPDVTKLTGGILPRIDIVYGGFPCQDISCAGRGKGLAGERSGLFFEIMRLVDDLRPRFIFLENVPAILVRGGVECTYEIARRGYDCRWEIVSANEEGLPQKEGRRWYLVAKAKSVNVVERVAKKSEQGSEDQTSGGHDKPDDFRTRKLAANRRYRELHGIRRAVERIEALGNSVVPQCAKEAFKRLMGL